MKLMNYEKNYETYLHEDYKIMKKIELNILIN